MANPPKLMRREYRLYTNVQGSAMQRILRRIAPSLNADAHAGLLHCSILGAVRSRSLARDFA
jgi:hypothetical protein